MRETFSCDDLRFLTECQIPAGWLDDPDTHRLLARRFSAQLDEARDRGEDERIAFIGLPIDELHGGTLASRVAENLPARGVAHLLIRALDYR